MQIPSPPRPTFGSRPWTQQDATALSQALTQRQVVFVDVDTQNDFIQANGALSVTGAESIRPQLAKLNAWSRALSQPVVATQDTHASDDPEFETYNFPPHCVYNTPGWEKVPETLNDRPQWLIPQSESPMYLPDGETLQGKVAQGTVFTLQKNKFDVFEANPWATPLFEALKGLGIHTAVVYGVATDYCVKAAVAGLKQLGLTPLVVQDAIKHVASADLENPADPVYGDVTAVTTDELEAVVNPLSHFSD